MPEYGILKLPRKDILTYPELHRLVNILKKSGFTKFRFTGGEPFVRNKSMDFFESIDLKEFSITTNLALPDLEVERINKLPLKSINISCDSLKAQRYEYITRGGDLKIFLNNLAGLKVKNIKLNVVLIKNFNEDEIYDFINFAKEKNLTVRFIEKMDIIKDNLQFVSLETLKKRLINENVISEKGDYIEHSVAVYHHLKDNSNIKIGFITPVSHPFCAYCNKIRIKANGDIKLCIYSNRTYNIRDILRQETDDNKIIKWLENIIKLKPYSSFNELREEPMSQIGG